MKSKLATPSRTATPNTSKQSRGRPSKGQLIYASYGWGARIVTIVDGEKVRTMVRLGTTSKAAAKRKLERLLAEPSAALASMKDIAARPETYAELADRVAATRTKEGVADVAAEVTREKLWILPEIGQMALVAITPEHIAAIYEGARAAGRSQSTLRHLRAVLRSRFAIAVNSGLASNPLDRVRIPKVKIDRRERAVLTDDELATYLGWEHPQEKHRLAVLERQTMSAIARMFGGVRTGDLHSMSWAHFDSAEGSFTWGMALRKKTARPQKIEIPDMLRPILRDWWERQGRPTSGLVFPALRGKRAGEGIKIGVSHAAGLRRDLSRALGIEAWNAAEGKFEKPRAMTEREHELLKATEFTRPVDFHSWRRRFVQALADMGMNAQQAQKLAGHADLSAHERYLRTTSKTLVIPAAALPAFKVTSQIACLNDPADLVFSGRAPQDSNLRPLDSKSSALSS